MAGGGEAAELEVHEILNSEEAMDEEVFNLTLRKFLKRFGVTAQREIEKAVEGARERGTLTGDERLPVRATLTIPGVLAEFEIDGEIALAGPAPRGES
jgi:hypothetical protein